MTTIEDNLATLWDPCSVQAWKESSKHGKEEKSPNVIKVPLARDKSHFEHRRSNISNPGENVAHAQPSVAQEQDEIQNSNFEHVSGKLPREDIEENDRKPAAKSIKHEPEDEPHSWAQEEQEEAPPPKPWADKKTTKQYSESIFLLEKMVNRIMM